MNWLDQTILRYNLKRSYFIIISIYVVNKLSKKVKIDKSIEKIRK